LPGQEHVPIERFQVQNSLARFNTPAKTSITANSLFPFNMLTPTQTTSALSLTCRRTSGPMRRMSMRRICGNNFKMRHKLSERLWQPVAKKKVNPNAEYAHRSLMMRHIEDARLSVMVERTPSSARDPLVALSPPAQIRNSVTHLSNWPPRCVTDISKSQNQRGLLRNARAPSPSKDASQQQRKHSRKCPEMEIGFVSQNPKDVAHASRTGRSRLFPHRPHSDQLPSPAPSPPLPTPTVSK
jgi:hypothetical protein